MARMMPNNWLQRVGGKRPESGTQVFDALFDLPIREARHILQTIRDYDGTKVMVSCTDDTNLESVLKLSLCLASVTIVVPAPLWVSCGGRTRYCEFNYESVGTNGWNSAAGVLKKISDLAVRFPQVFEDGAVTFLPVLGESLHRWFDPELDLPELPSPYSTHPRRYTSQDIRREALYGLCGERLVAERMGAIHLNFTTFACPVLNDFVISPQTPTDNQETALVEIDIPDLTLISVSEILHLRRQLSTDFPLFSAALRDAFQANRTPAQRAEGLRLSAGNVSRHLESQLAIKVPHMEGGALPKMTLALRTLRNSGAVTHAINFLTEGGGFGDFDVPPFAVPVPMLVLG